MCIYVYTHTYMIDVYIIITVTFSYHLKNLFFLNFKVNTLRLLKMKRGNYKQYSSIDKMLKSTRYDLAKKLKVQESDELKKIYNQNLDSFIQQKIPNSKNKKI